jgi:hypothetical protein
VVATVSEGFRSRTVNRGSNESIERLYTVIGTDDDAEAEAALLAATPSDYRDLLRTEYKVEEQQLGLWKGTVTYSPLNLQQREPADLGSTEGEVSYATGSGTAKRLHSLETVNRYRDTSGDWFPVEPPDFKGLIGVQKDGVEGVEIGVPAPTYRETHVFTPASLTLAYRRTVSRMAYTVNEEAFKGFEAGEALFIGAEFTQRDSEKIIGVYSFAISENETALTVGDITGIEKDGHDYLWVLYGDAEDETAEYIVKKPIAAYVERVYRRTDFASLQIGT